MLDAVAGLPGTYVYTNSYGQTSFGFSEDLWVQAENFMDESDVALQATAASAADKGMTLQWDPNPILTVYVQDFGNYSVESGLIPDYLQLQADHDWIMNGLTPKQAAFFDIYLPAPSLLTPGNPNAYLLPFMAAYSNCSLSPCELGTYNEERNAVYGVTATQVRP